MLLHIDLTFFFNKLTTKFKRFTRLLYKGYQVFPFILGFLGWAFLSISHHWFLFESMGLSFMWTSAVFSTVVIALTGYSVFKKFAKEIFRLFVPMSFGFIGLCFVVMGMSNLGLALTAWGTFNLFRSLSGHMDESYQDWLLSMSKSLILNIFIFSMMIALNAQSYLLPVCVLTSVFYLVWDRPVNYSGVGMVGFSFISAYFSWLLSTFSVIFPSVMASMGVHVFYHDALLTITAIGAAMFLKQNAQKGRSIPFPNLKVTKNGSFTVVPQSKLRVGDLVELTADASYLPGLKFQVTEVIKKAECINQHSEDRTHKLKLNDLIGYASVEDETPCMATQLSSGTVRAKVINVSSDPKIFHDPGQNVLKYFMPAMMLTSLTAFCFWTYIGMPSQAFNVLINTLIIACPCTFTTVLPLLENKALKCFNDQDIKLWDLDSVECSTFNTLVIDRSHTIVNQNSGEGVWKMTPKQKNALVSLVNTTGAKNVLILSGHDEEKAKAAMEKDIDEVKKRLAGTHVRVWMNKCFNSQEDSARKDLASENKGLVIQYLKTQPFCFEHGFESFKKKALLRGSWPYKYASKNTKVMMVGDGQNDILALQKASFGLHVGKDYGVLQQSAAGATVLDFSSLNTKNLKKLFSHIKLFNNYSYRFKFAAVALNVLAVVLSTGGWYLMFGYNMPCGLGCVAMELFSFTFAMIAKDYAFEKDLIMNSKKFTTPVEKFFKPVVSMVTKAYGRVFQEPEQDNCCDCGHHHHH